DGWNFSSFRQQGKLPVYEFVVETHVRRICSRIGIVDAVKLRPINRTEAHGTRLAAREDIAVRQVDAIEHGACLANSDDFGMGAGIGCGSDLVPPLRDNPVIAHDHRPKWAL